MIGEERAFRFYESRIGRSSGRQVRDGSLTSAYRVVKTTSELSSEVRENFGYHTYPRPVLPDRG